MGKVTISHHTWQAFNFINCNHNSSLQISTQNLRDFFQPGEQVEHTWRNI